MIILPSKAAVVIPVYKSELNELEKISLAQVRKILKNYPIIFVAPAEVKYPYFTPSDSVVYFPPQFFQGVQTYNYLMMSPNFYAAFKDFEYILIYQLDAFVFRDELEYFCSLGYDYIGAPWPKIYRDNVKENFSCVGNGGFSLRNVKNSYELLKGHSDLVEQWHARNFPEDVFFSHCGKRDDCNFLVAPINVAYKFSAEFNPPRVVKKNGGKLPFGCHAWYRQYQEFYTNVFLKLGYDLRSLKINSDGGLRNWLMSIAFQRLARRFQRGQSILSYLPTKRFASVRVIRHPITMMILARLLFEDSSLADKIFLYDPDEQDLLLQDLTLQKLPHLLIDVGGA